MVYGYQVATGALVGAGVKPPPPETKQRCAVPSPSGITAGSLSSTQRHHWHTGTRSKSHKRGVAELCVARTGCRCPPSPSAPPGTPVWAPWSPRSAPPRGRGHRLPRTGPVSPHLAVDAQGLPPHCLQEGCSADRTHAHTHTMCTPSRAQHTQELYGQRQVSGAPDRACHE